MTRYLSPEPMLEKPEVVRAALALGVQLPTYGYALNNPIRESDSTGGIPNSLAARALVLMGQGDFAGAAALLAAGGYERAARAMLELGQAFSRSNQGAGPCYQFALRIYNGFRDLGLINTTAS